MSRRIKSDPSAPAVSAAEPTTEPGKPGGKGRPTPTRKEAEAAAKARAKVPRTRKEVAAAKRAARVESNQKVREAMKSGDDRHLPTRDRGPVRRFVRDFIDARFSVIELMIPVMLVTLVMGWSGNSYLVQTGNMILLGTLVVIVLDAVFLRMRLRQEVRRRFPEAPLKGLTYYAIMRAFQMRFMRLPKTQVKIGQELPEHYR